MDQVIQSNAASSEESASASEELSAQAAELKEMVGVLASMVGGSSENGRGMVVGTSAPAPFRAKHLEPVLAQGRALAPRGDGG